MNMDKTIAKIVEKCYSGKASIKDISFLLKNILVDTSIGNNINGNLPSLNFNMKKDPEGHLLQHGEYSFVDTNLYINEIVVNNARFGNEHGLFQLIETYGHEMTHHNQNLIGNLSRGDTPNYDRKSVKGMCRAVGLDVGEAFCGNIEHASYLKQPHELEARDGGAVFAVEVFSNFLQNKYLKQEVREKILSDLEFARKNVVEHEQKNEIYYKQYETFIEFFKSRNIQNFMGEDDRSPYSDCYNAFGLWSSQNSPETLCNSYLTLIGSGSDYLKIRTLLANRIKSQDFPQEIRDKMIGAIVNTLKKGELDEQYYEYRLTEVLDDKQILEIYRELFVKNLKKINGTLFFQLELNEQYAPVIGKIIVDNLNKINSEEDMEMIANKVGAVLMAGENTLPLELKNQLSEFKFKMDRKKKAAQTVKDDSKKVRIN